MTSPNLLGLLFTKLKPKDDEQIHPKHIFLCFLALVCLVTMYIAVVCFTWSRHQDLKWKATLDSNPYFADVKTIFRSARLNEYFRWMQIMSEIQKTWATGDEPESESSSSGKGKRIQSRKVRTNKVLGQNYQDKLEKDARQWRKLNIQRAFKIQEQGFQGASLVLLIVAHAIFILPFFCKLQVRFRSRLFKISLLYGVLGSLCFLAGVVEIQSVFETDSVYREYEDLALNGSKAAALVASCGLSENEFTGMVKQLGLLEMRKSFHVCQSAGLKLTAAFIFAGVGLIYGAFCSILCRDYRYAMRNKIVPGTEVHVMEIENHNATLIELSNLAEEDRQEENTKKQKEKPTEGEEKPDQNKKHVGIKDSKSSKTANSGVKATAGNSPKDPTATTKPANLVRWKNLR